MVSHRKTLSWLLAAMVCAAVVGCGGAGGKLATVTGKIVEGGKPLTLEGREYQEGAAYVEVTFFPLDQSGKIQSAGKSYGAMVKPDGTFVVSGDEGKGIPVGKYRVALRHQRPSSGYNPAAQAQSDPWANKFDASHSPFEFDIQGDQAIELDVTIAGEAPKSGS